MVKHARPQRFMTGLGRLRWYTCVIAFMPPVARIALSVFAVAPLFAAQTTSFDTGWRFLKADAPGAEQPAFDDTQWRAVTLPHDWSIEGPFDQKNPSGQAGAFLPNGVGWYRKHFTLPAADATQHVSLDFDGVMANSDVWINGFHLGKRPYGYVSFRYDLTGHLNFGAKPQRPRRARRQRPTARLPLVPRRRHLPPRPPGRHQRRPRRTLGHVRHHPNRSRRRGDRPASKPTIENDSLNRARRNRRLQPRAHPAAPLSHAQPPPPRRPCPAKTLRRHRPRHQARPTPNSGTSTTPRPLHAVVASRAPLASRSTKTPSPSASASSTSTPPPASGSTAATSRSRAPPCTSTAAPSASPSPPPSGSAASRPQARSASTPSAPPTTRPRPSSSTSATAWASSSWTRCSTAGPSAKTPTTTTSTSATGRSRDTARHRPARPQPPQHHPLQRRQRDPRHAQRRARQRHPQRPSSPPSTQNDPTRPVTQALFRPNVSHDYDDGLADLLDVVGQNYRENEILAAHAAKPTRKIIGTENHARPQRLARPARPPRTTPASSSGPASTTSAKPATWPLTASPTPPASSTAPAASSPILRAPKLVVDCSERSYRPPSRSRAPRPHRPRLRTRSPPHSNPLRRLEPN